MHRQLWEDCRPISYARSSLAPCVTRPTRLLVVLYTLCTHTHLSVDVRDITRTPRRRNRKENQRAMHHELDLQRMAADALGARYRQLYAFIHHMPMKTKRSIFSSMRHARESPQCTFLPEHGLYCGEFAVFQLLNEYNRKCLSKGRLRPNRPGAASEGPPPGDAVVAGGDELRDVPE